MFKFNERRLGKFDVAVCGGGIAGIGAALNAARNGADVVLIESLNSLGGTVTEGIMGNIMDGKNKGGLISEIYHFLEARDMTCANRGPKIDENGKRITGRILDIEGTKYCFEKLCLEAGVRILYSSTVCGVDMKGGHINSIMISTYCGNFIIEADIFIDATGNGNLSALCDLKWECGNPPNPASLSIFLGGLPSEINGTDSVEAKLEYGEMLKEKGYNSSAETICVKKHPSLSKWVAGYNFEYDVLPEDIIRLSDAVIDARDEAFKLVEAYKKVEGCENVYLSETAGYLGIREGRRIFGEYRITTDDIKEGRRFEDGICLVTMVVDLHKTTASDDPKDVSRGIKTKPYHIPYRSLVPLGCNNMLLAGRCISGDYYPFASYRVIGNMATVGEAAGYAASLCIKEKISPKQVDGKKVSDYMKSLGHDI
ncbi:MAG: FAD-dependent oxidoreductase [Ruminococcaceae bacterium]|nr:FAD-dependent oxidoreductase [Oscillospiraceae bacterium]